MRVPLEILRLILRDAVEVLPLQDLLRARLVNSRCDPSRLPDPANAAQGIFADEIASLLPCSSRMEEDQTLFRTWFRFPFKREYLQHKLQRHESRPCLFSTLAREILDLPSVAALSKEEQDAVVDKLIDAVIWGRKEAEDLLSARRYKPYMDWYYSQLLDFMPMRWEPVEDTLQIALATSAIQRGDHQALQTLLDHGVEVHRSSHRLGLVPLDVACKIGNGAVIQTLVRYRCPLEYYSYVNRFWNRKRALTVAARSGNKEALETWVTQLRDAGRGISEELAAALRGAVQLGRLDMVEMLEKCCGSGEMAAIRFDCLIDAIKDAQLDAVGWFLRRGDIDLTSITAHCTKGPLFTALHDCRGAPATKTAIVQLLLEHGVDPNGVYPPIARTPLQRAVEDGEVGIATLLVEHGADVNAVGESGRVRSPPLYLAAKRGSAPLVRLLLAHGAERSYRWKGKTFIVQTDATVIASLERVLEELGWTAGEISDAQISYFVLDEPVWGKSSTPCY
ncbi:uncharacterized protein N7459_001489 [Penicillium hispanicum]|uniref:uncharacterized protein n=1 Tax=Penicillium hispanicum TaxID=1080232 RepID=UPI002541FADD|nr:uncharacterized protein N7459_001489 [Penicillium hispanicum]KAJ5595281.1 hypothetical protein N7459_001489 [Penicillium hispanicum]